MKILKKYNFGKLKKKQNPAFWLSMMLCLTLFAIILAAFYILPFAFTFIGVAIVLLIIPALAFYLLAGPPISPKIYDFFKFVGSKKKGQQIIIADHKNLSELNLQNTRLNKSFLLEANLKGANLRNAGLDHSILTNANLSGADISNAVLNEAKAIGTNFSNANLKSSKFIKAKLQNAELVSANLNQADFTGANLKGANLRNAQIQNTQWKDAVFNSSTILPFSEKKAVKLGMVRSD